MGKDQLTNQFAKRVFRRAVCVLLIFYSSCVYAGQTMEQPNEVVRELRQQVVESGDSRGRPFMIVDKVGARVFAFDDTGTLVAEAAALLGAAPGDIAPPGIGNMRLSEITPAQRITQAGRFESRLGENLAGRVILWLDYESALSMHPVVTGNVAERRLERLATPSAHDNRISYGCINVPADFFEDTVEALFATWGGVVYVLPESPASTVRLVDLS